MPRTRVPLVLRWDGEQPAPRISLRLSAHTRVVVPRVPNWIETGESGRAFDFSRAMHDLNMDIVRHTPALAHIDVSRILFSITRARTGSRHGLQARVTPLRFQGGAVTRLYRGWEYQVQRIQQDGREILYLISFCLPRFLNRDFTDKLVTVFHELYHISPAFDGDLRRHPGRYSAHTSSQKNYDAAMTRLVRQYLSGAADDPRNHFLRLSFAQLCQKHGSIHGLSLPRPKLVPIDPPSRLRPG